MEYSFKIGKEEHSIRVEPSKNSAVVELGSQKYTVKTISSDISEIQLEVNDEKIIANMAFVGATHFVSIDGVSFEIQDKDAEDDLPESDSERGSSLEDEVKAPMPGKLIKIFVKEGDSVKAGSKVAILEAMKMENELLSPKEGKIVKILVKESELVDAGQKIVELE